MTTVHARFKGHGRDDLKYDYIGGDFPWEEDNGMIMFYRDSESLAFMSVLKEDVEFIYINWDEDEDNEE